jgi:hypothetical protein
MLVKYAESELRRAGLFDADSDYDGAIGPAVLELVEKFAAQGHSGFSAHLTLSLFDTVAHFKPLSPITSDPNEWMEVESGKMWQSKRSPTLFSKDGGKTWYDLDAIPQPKEPL